MLVWNYLSLKGLQNYTFLYKVCLWSRQSVYLPCQNQGKYWSYIEVVSACIKWILR